jgi:hypothetical protein
MKYKILAGVAIVTSIAITVGVTISLLVMFNVIKPVYGDCHKEGIDRICTLKGYERSGK